MMHPTTPQRLKERQKSFEKEQTRLEAEPALPGLTLPCGCRVELFNHHGIKVVYCERHEGFHYSPRPDTGTDVFYFVTGEVARRGQENKP